MCIIFLSRIKNPAQANQAPLLTLINTAQANQASLPSLINPAQANQAIRQTKEIHEKSRNRSITRHETGGEGEAWAVKTAKKDHVQKEQGQW